MTPRRISLTKRIIENEQGLALKSIASAQVRGAGSRSASALWFFFFDADVCVIALCRHHLPLCIGTSATSRARRSNRACQSPVRTWPIKGERNKRTQIAPQKEGGRRNPTETAYQRKNPNKRQSLSFLPPPPPSPPALPLVSPLHSAPLFGPPPRHSFFCLSFFVLSFVLFPPLMR